MREAKAEGKKVLWVGGPGVVHTGAAPAMVAMVEAGFVDVLFAGNALATHDIESSLYGTSLGVDLSHGHGVEHGHEHHIRALNTIRKEGSIQAAVDHGVLTGGIMHALVKQGKEFVLVGSVRDDGPLPDVYTDVIEGQRAMRAKLTDVGFCLMVATMLHSVATGNILPASIPLVCVDINPATVTKLADRGSSRPAASSPTSGSSSSSSRTNSCPSTDGHSPAAGLLHGRPHHVGGADGSGLGAEGGRQDGRHAAVVGTHEGPAERLARGPHQQVTGRRHPAADDDDVRVERGDEVGHPHPEPVSDHGEAIEGQLVALLGGAGHHRSGQCLGVAATELVQLGRLLVEPGPGVAHERVAAGVLLPAAAPAALALASVGHHLHVTELPGHAVVPAVHPAVDDDGATDPGPESHHDGVHGATRRAVPDLGACGAVGVVVEYDGGAPPLHQPGADLLAPERQVRGEHDPLTRGIHETCGSDAHTVDAPLAGDVVDRVGQRVLDHRRVHAAVGVDLRATRTRRPLEVTAAARTLVPPTSTPM